MGYRYDTATRIYSSSGQIPLSVGAQMLRGIDRTPLSRVRSNHRSQIFDPPQTCVVLPLEMAKDSSLLQCAISSYTSIIHSSSSSLVGQKAAKYVHAYVTISKS